MPKNPTQILNAAKTKATSQIGNKAYDDAEATCKKALKEAQEAIGLKRIKVNENLRQLQMEVLALQGSAVSKAAQQKLPEKTASQKDTATLQKKNPVEKSEEEELQEAFELEKQLNSEEAKAQRELEKFGEFQSAPIKPNVGNATKVSADTITKEKMDEITSKLEKLNKESLAKEPTKDDWDGIQEPDMGTREEQIAKSKVIVSEINKDFNSRQKVDAKIKNILEKVDLVLAGFISKRDSIGTHLKEAENVAAKLSDALADARDEYAYQLKNGKSSDDVPMDFLEAGKMFKLVCETEIKAAMPVLERDLSWGDYLKNMLKTIANAVIGAAQKLGSSATFFTHATSESPSKTAETNQALQEIDVSKPKP